MFETLLAALLYSGLSADPTQARPCGFTVVMPAPTEIPVQGPDEIISRLKLLPQPGSPVVVTAADFSDTLWHANPGSYTVEGRIGIELQNVSDQPVEQVDAAHAIRWVDRSGGIAATRPLTQVLLPGRRAVVNFLASARGTRDQLVDVEILIGVGEVVMNGCRFQATPSIHLTVRASGQ